MLIGRARMKLIVFVSCFKEIRIKGSESRDT